MQGSLGGAPSPIPGVLILPNTRGTFFLYTMPNPMDGGIYWQELTFEESIKYRNVGPHPNWVHPAASWAAVAVVALAAVVWETSRFWFPARNAIAAP